MTNFNQLATDKSLASTKKALENNGFNVLIANSSKGAVTVIEKLVPFGSEIIDNTSKTLDDTGIRKLISKKYVSVNEATRNMDREKDGRKINEMRSVGDYTMGSAHAITEDGKIMIASGTGSQLPGYAFGAKHVIFVAGTNKIVKNLDDGYNRIYTHSLPLESERANKAYNITTGSNVRRILIMNSEANPRTTVLLIKENLGF